MRIVYFVTVLILFLFSCSGKRNNFRLELHEDGSDGSMVYLARRSISGTAVIDSALPDKSGTYVFEGYTSLPDFYVVYHHIREYINLIIQPADDFSVLTHAESFDVNYLVEGSKDSRLIQKMVSMQNKTLAKITELSTRYENSLGQPDFETVKAEIDSIYERVVAGHKQFSIDLIRENPGSLAGLMALYQQLGRNTPVFDYKDDFQYYEMVNTNLAALYPNSEAVIDLNRKVTELREVLKLEIGAQAPEISLPDSANNLLSLSSLRGKMVVLAFWASWSTQSVEQMRELARLYPTLTDRNVRCYQVSLDRTRESWLKGIAAAGNMGIHVSDLKYWDSPVVEMYHIEQLPVTYLLDKNGVIVNKDFSIGELPELLNPLTK